MIFGLAKIRRLSQSFTLENTLKNGYEIEETLEKIEIATMSHSEAIQTLQRFV